MPVMPPSLADLCAVCAVHRGHRGAGAPDLARAHHPRPALHLPRGLSLLWGCQKVMLGCLGVLLLLLGLGWRESTRILQASQENLCLSLVFMLEMVL